MNRDREYTDFGDPDGDPAGGGLPGDEFEEFESPYLRGDPEEEALRDFDEEPLRLVDQVLILLPDRDPSRPLLYQLRRQLMEREITFQEARRALVELEAALEKVTSPSNRVGICIDAPREGIATILVGGSE